MRKWTKTKAATLLFMAVSSVYPARALRAEPANGAKGAGTEVKLLDETAGPGAAKAAEAEKVSEGTPVAASQVNVSDAGTVEIHVNDANLVEVLRMLSLQSQKNIIASKDVRGSVTANLYNVTIREALDAILKANGYAYKEKGNFIYVYTAKELADMEKADRQMTTEVYRLHYSPAANAANMIKPALSADGVVSMSIASEKGIGNGGSDAGGFSHATEDVLVVRDYPENLEKARAIIKELDRRPQQVLVEATIAAVRLNDNNSLGVDFNIIGGVDFSRLGIGNGQITNANVATGTGGAPAGNNTRFSSVGTGNSFTRDNPNGFKIGFVSSSVSVFVSALEDIGQTAVLANPKVLTLNKQKGEVLVGREDGYLTTTVTESTAVQTVEFLQTGTRLVFRPFIGDDGYIRMEVHPEDSDGRVVSGLPQKTTTEVTTNIMVKDGHTVVIGGLFREGSSTGRSQVPGLGNLPIVGALFRNQNDQTTREEIIIMLTPHIVKDDASYSKASEEAMKDIDKMRVGVRKGMMPWGRERLAESCYNNAVEEMNKPSPDRKRAMWYLDCATNLNPRFLEALKMKEQVSGKELSTVDNSTVRHFVRKQIMAEKMASAQLLEAPLPEVEKPAQRSQEAAAPTTQPTGAQALLETEEMDEFDPEFAFESEQAQAEAEAAALEAEIAKTKVVQVQAPTTQPTATPSVITATDESDAVDGDYDPDFDD